MIEGVSDLLEGKDADGGAIGESGRQESKSGYVIIFAFHWCVAIPFIAGRVEAGCTMPQPRREISGFCSLSLLRCWRHFCTLPAV